MSGGHVNSRKMNPDPPVAAHIHLPESMWKAIDATRGKQSRQGFIRDAITQALYYEGLEIGKK